METGQEISCRCILQSICRSSPSRRERFYAEQNLTSIERGEGPGASSLVQLVVL